MRTRTRISLALAVAALAAGGAGAVAFGLSDAVKRPLEQPPASGGMGTPPSELGPVDSCNIDGSAGGDRLRGRAARDIICGKGGNDRIYAAKGGLDTIYAGPGNDIIYARNGKADLIYGGSGRDRARIDPVDRQYMHSVEKLLK